MIELREELLTLRASVDVDEFERAAEQAHPAAPGAYRAAASFYGGELLPENRYDDWVAGRREEIEQLRVKLAAEISAGAGGCVSLSGLPPRPARSSVAVTSCESCWRWRRARGC